MKIYIEFYASLMKYLPPGKSRFRREIQVDEGIILNRVIERFNITQEEAHIALVNGFFVCGEDRESKVLEAGDVVGLWPPVGGG